MAHTFVATIGAITHCGAKPVLVDITDDFNMDVSKIEEAITPKTKGIIPVHLNGHMCDMEKIMAIAQNKGLTVIEDSAQALGSQFKGKRAASFGKCGIFSFYPAKMLGAAGDGGILCTNDDAFGRKMRALRDNGRLDSVEVIECYGYCSRLDNLQAALLNVKFDRFPQWVERRREIARRYDEGLSGIDGLSIHPVSEKDYYDVYQNYVIRTPRRDELVRHLKDSGVEVIISWPTPLHKQKAVGLAHFELPVTERVSAEVISLPIFPELTDEEVDYVVDSVKRFF